jgi:hypothetical protein
VILLDTELKGKPRCEVHLTVDFQSNPVRGAEIFEALTAATRTEDLADAFAWIQRFHASDTAQGQLHFIRHRATVLSTSSR